MRRKGELPRSNLEFLQDEGDMPKEMSLEEAVEVLTDPLNCVECIAASECTDRYGHITGEMQPEECRIVVRAFLRQDHKEEKKNDGGEHQEPHA